MNGELFSFWCGKMRFFFSEFFSIFLEINGFFFVVIIRVGYLGYFIVFIVFYCNVFYCIVLALVFIF